MEPKNSRNLRASFNASAEECRKALAEYYQLARLPELSEEEFLRMQDILAVAESNDAMGLLINEIDEITFQELDLYDDSQRLYFEDQVSKAQEFVLDETERKLLTPSIIARQTKFVSHHTTSPRPPRVEMVFDASHTARMQLENRYLMDDLSTYEGCERLCWQGGVAGNHQRFRGRIKRFLYNLFIEESVSLLTVAALVGIMFCLVLV